VARLVTPASFMLPKYVSQSSWHEHAPFGFWLVDTFRPLSIVELGTWYGYSYFVFCQAVQKQDRLHTRTYAVDTWKGDGATGYYGEDVFKTVLDYNEANYASFSTLIRGMFHYACADFPDGSIDLLHIDGSHTYDDVKRDFRTWLPKLRDSSIVLIHDIDVRTIAGYDVWRYYDEICARYPHFEFNHGFGLGVVAPKGIPPTLVDLFTASFDQAQAVRNVYHLLGITQPFRGKIIYDRIGHEIMSGLLDSVAA
jgi:hypothetical protein